MIALTHLLFALTLAYILRLPVVYAMIGGVLPEADVLLHAEEPFVQQGMLHTPLFALFAGTALYLALGRREPAYALGVGMLANLYLDTLTNTGVMWLFPVTDTSILLGLANALNPFANLGIILLSVLTATGWRYRSEVTVWTRR